MQSYDSEPMFNSVNPENFLIYKLVKDRNKVLNAIKAADSNKILFEEYSQKIEVANKISSYTKNPLRIYNPFLKRVERKLANKLVYKPDTSFSITVVLSLYKMSGDFVGSTKQTFSSTEILNLVSRIKNQEDGYYKEDYIWDSICAVERSKVSNKIRFYIYKRDGNRCCKCGSSSNLEIDHIIPISKGGKSTIDNLQTLCHKCNVEKGADFE